MGIATNRPYAVVTGASSGIGLELARECIEHDFDLLICAEDPGIHEAGVSRAFELASEERSKTDSAAAPGAMQRAPGPPPVPGARPSPRPAPQPAPQPAPRPAQPEKPR